VRPVRPGGLTVRQENPVEAEPGQGGRAEVLAPEEGKR
jgi:hypothetical protein